MSAPLVSTVIPVFNRAAMLREAVHSVLAQNYRPLEILVVDNASTDGTAAVAAELASRHPGEVRVLHCAERGAGAAREVGRAQARGDYVQYLDSDDLLLPHKFARQVAALQAHPGCGIACGVTRLRGAAGAVLHEPWKRTGERIQTLFPSMLAGRWWGTSTPLYRRSLVDAAGPWLNLLNEEDWEYDCRIAALGVRLAHVPQVVSEERAHGGERLSRGGGSDPQKLRDRARAHALILEHARRAGVGPDVPEMRHFARALFLLCRQCGARGLAAESRRLFDLSRAACADAGGRGADLRIYGAMARLLGWGNMGRLSQRLDAWRGAGGE